MAAGLQVVAAKAVGQQVTGQRVGCGHGERERRGGAGWSKRGERRQGRKRLG